MLEKFESELLDDCHWYVKPVIDPSASVISLVSAVSVWPSANVPLTASVCLLLHPLH